MKQQQKLNKKPRILLMDIETMANLGYVWGKWEQNVISFKENWFIITFSWKWLGDTKTNVISLPDYSTYKKNKSDDKELVKKIWELFDEADVVIGHNSDEFDIKKINSRFLTHGLTPPSPYKTVDTKKIAKRYFRFDSNKLDDLGEYLSLGRKIDTGGFDLWLGCVNNDKSSWDKMCKYNKQDVILLEKIYLKMLPYITNGPNLNVLNGNLEGCPNCGSCNVMKRGFSITRTGKYQRWQCKDCSSWSQGEKVKSSGVVLK